MDMKSSLVAWCFAASIGIFCSASLVQNIQADSLDEFEKAATKNHEEHEKKESGNHSGDDDDERECGIDIGCSLTDEIGRFVGDVITAPFRVMAKSSVERTRGSVSESGFEYTKRLPHDRDIPIVELNTAYQAADDSINGVETKAEVGYGPVGLEYRNMNYDQDAPPGHLELSHYHVLLRGSFQTFQLNIGIGRATIDGVNHNSGNSQLAQIMFFPSKRMEFGASYISNQINGNGIREYDGYAGVGLNGFAMRAGYRSNKVGSNEIRGPYLGLTWRY
jgi:hypothetical protein